ncbi:RsmE family RNA methyltransferase [Dyadobacter tibetensis]|uniref:RsmE family RNA methyltransferase n=1 Tax=Dyadobacter tibetensis TaxID=1211851 RepID=UPI00046EB115|nr:RsmE family RNA methyltransferase [Dyadobacter tibetensis]
MHLFYQSEPSKTELDDEESRHIFKVLRLRTDDIIYITDGKGMLQKCCIQYQGKKVQYKVLETIRQIDDKPTLTMVVAPTRKAERNEWMVEKMTEIGVRRIIFIVTSHTHKEGLGRVVNLMRLQRIAAGAMKQSQQYFLPEIRLENSFEDFLKEPFVGTRMIAYVPLQHDTKHAFEFVRKQSDTIVLIGPEGDFTEAEVESAKGHGYIPVSLGPTRLRTETAAVAACHAVNLAYQVQ